MQGPDTDAQDHPLHLFTFGLHRTAGPYKWVKSAVVTVGGILPVNPHKRTSSSSAATSQCAKPGNQHGAVTSRMIPGVGLFREHSAILRVRQQGYPMTDIGIYRVRRPRPSPTLLRSSWTPIATVRPLTSARLQPRRFYQGYSLWSLSRIATFLRPLVIGGGCALRRWKSGIHYEGRLISEISKKYRLMAGLRLVGNARHSMIATGR
jgi:hypothetical protein